mmetsp:Transcript_63318/g.136151  ORF Transcript_63318/g.136151 Transcript_63318/m.136151 type:complete len:267 (+) Transcript_63318:886-1686(+)
MVVHIPVSDDHRHIGTKADVRQHAEFLCCNLEMLQNSCLLGPHLPVSRILANSLHHLPAKPHMERPDLCLQLGGLVRSSNPTIPTHSVVAVKANDVAVTRLQVHHASLQTMVAATYNGYRMRPSLYLRLEAGDAPDYDITADLVYIVLLTEGATGFHYKLHVLWRDHDRRCQGLLHIEYSGASLHWQHQLLVGAVHLESDVLPRRAEDPPLDATPVPRRVEDVEAHVNHSGLLLQLPLAPVPQGRGRRRASIAAHGALNRSRDEAP